jgi:cell division protein FtsL
VLKILLCLIFAVALSVVTLHLRQQKLEIAHQANDLHNRIEALQAKLWNQQVRIAIPTAPNAISQTLHTQELQMVPRNASLPGNKSNWLEPQNVTSRAE